LEKIDICYLFPIWLSEEWETAEEVSRDRKWENVYLSRGNFPEEDFSPEKI